MTCRGQGALRRRVRRGRRRPAGARGAAHTRTHARTHARTRTHTRTHAHAHTPTHAPTRARAHTHTQADFEADHRMVSAARQNPWYGWAATLGRRCGRVPAPRLPCARERQTMVWSGWCAGPWHDLAGPAERRAAPRGRRRVLSCCRWAVILSILYNLTQYFQYYITSSISLSTRAPYVINTILRARSPRRCASVSSPCPASASRLRAAGTVNVRTQEAIEDF